MTHLIALTRPLTLGAPLDWSWAAVHFGYNVALMIAAFALAYWRIRKRMFD